jgi:hypothetical protein
MTETRKSTLKSTASNARMGKLRVGHLRTDAEQARALARALLEAADEYAQMAGYDQITVFNNSCFDSEPGG